MTNETTQTQTKASYMNPDISEKPEKKPVEKVVSGAVVSKNSAGKQLKEALFGDLTEVKGYLLWDVFIPAVKDTIVELIKNGAEALFYGRSSPKYDHVKRSGGRSYVPYHQYSSYDPSKHGKKPAYNGYNGYSQRRRSVYDFADVSFASRADAEKVLNRLVELTYEYGCVSVAEYRELSGLPSNYTDNRYGWGALNGVPITLGKNGYYIEFPEPEPLYE